MVEVELTPQVIVQQRGTKALMRVLATHEDKAWCKSLVSEKYYTVFIKDLEVV